MKRLMFASAVALAVPLLSGSPAFAPAALAAPALKSTEAFVETVAMSDMFEIESRAARGEPSREREGQVLRPGHGR